MGKKVYINVRQKSIYFFDANGERIRQTHEKYEECINRLKKSGRTAYGR